MRHHSQPPMRKLLAASRRSPGNAAAPAMTLNRMYHWVPRTISGVSQMSAFKLEIHNEQHDRREQQVGGKRGEELCQWLRSPRPDRPQAEPDADRHPEQACQHHQHHHPDQREQAEPERLRRSPQLRSAATKPTIFVSAQTSDPTSTTNHAASTRRDGRSARTAAARPERQRQAAECRDGVANGIGQPTEQPGAPHQPQQPGVGGGRARGGLEARTLRR